MNGEMVAEAISQVTDNSILKTKGKVTLPAVSLSVVGIKTPTLPNPNNLYELNFSIFQFLEGVIPLDVVHRVNYKTPPKNFKKTPGVYIQREENNNIWLFICRLHVIQSKV